MRTKKDNRRRTATMDEKDWIILRLLLVLCKSPHLLNNRDVIETLIWVDKNIDIYSFNSPSDILRAEPWRKEQ